VDTAFGPFVGFVSGALLWVGITLAVSAVSSFFADSLVALVPALGGTGRAVAITVVLVVLAAANVRGARGVTRFNAVATVAKLLPLALLIVVGVVTMRWSNLVPTTPTSAAAVSRASVLLVFAFLGVESALVPSGEVKDPARTVPRAIFVAMAVVALLYVAIQLVAQGLLGAALPGDPTPLASAAGVALGPAGRTLILVGSAVSMFAYVSGMTLAVPRMLFAFGRDGFLPGALARVHTRFRTPHVAIVVQSAIVLGLALFARFEQLAVVANVAALLVYAACCVAAAELRRRDVRAGGTPFRVPGGAVVPWLALGVIAWILWGLRAEEWRAAGVVVAAAVVVYLVTARSRRARAEAA
jgi:amino acid transporter